MSYAALRICALEWDATQQTRLRLNNMLGAFERMERSVNPMVSKFAGDLQRVEAGYTRELSRIAADGEPWLQAVAQYVDDTDGLGPAVLAVVGLLPPLPNFAGPAKVWRYLGLHVTDGKAVRHPDPKNGEKFSPRLRAYATVRVVDPIIRNPDCALADRDMVPGPAPVVGMAIGAARP